MSLRKRIGACAIGLCLLLFSITGAVSAEDGAAPAAPDGYTLASQNRSLALYYKTDMASVAVMDKSSGKIWYSQLPDDQIPAQGITDILRSEFQSMLLISYALINKGTSSKTVSPLQSMSPTVTAKADGNGVAYEIAIKDIHLVFDVDIALTEDGMEVTIPDDKIQEGRDVDKQLQTKLDSIRSFIDQTTETAQVIKKSPDYPDNLKSYLNTGIRQLADLKDYIAKIDSVVGIESVSDKILADIDDIQSEFEGSASQPGFFNKIATSAKLSGDVKKKYAAMQQDFDDSTMPVRVNASSLKAINVGSLVEVEVLPYLGACGDGIDGYMLYPDGCGAINAFKEKHGQYASNYKSAVFTDTDPDIDWEKTMDSAGLKRTSIPYFGIKQGDSAFIAYVDAGQSDSNIVFSPSGYIANVSRVYSSFVYRSTVAVASSGGQWQAGQIPTAYEEARNTVNAGIHYIFLNGADANYSGMARMLRSYMTEKGILRKNPILSRGVPLALNFFGGYNKKILVFSNYITGTTFSQAGSILKKITQGSSPPLLVNYTGYQKGGYGVDPAPDQVAGQLGGLSGLQALSEYVKSINGYLFLEDNPVEAQIGAGGYSEGDLALGSDFRVIQSADKSTYLLAPQKVKERFLNSGLPFYKSTGTFGVTQDRMGTFIYSDYSDKHEAQRTDTTAIWTDIFEQTKEQVGGLAVNGCNEYAFPYADWIKDVPTSTSGYLQTDYAVPFCQMLMHGFIPYTSEAVNQYYDQDLQFLKMVEYGSIPYYTLSANEISANEAGAYVSPFDLYYDNIVDTYNRYAKDLAGVIDQPMLSHTIDGDLVTVEYADGTKVYINYSDNAVSVDSYEVPGMDFAVTKPEGGTALEKAEQNAGEQGEQRGVSVHPAVDTRIYPVLFVSAVLFAGAGIFLYKRRRHV